ncbi:hypothetical protein A1O3_05271 [Capronia epimyces CBS 606.96]|uniref:C2H2-type domain-containing protein n=1 Tax=Capronia epimyces CBS 606.96 TaxID=1182542 RepID=W9Y5V1_9EURO|nr:uncharacterized protein A1O3_05271 [Capronia epimyces CBS 606.96]EXJ84601.1 hypothetical protein A1O3_05271 [Capronia epimyces CBS 606.96]
MSNNSYAPQAPYHSDIQHAQYGSSGYDYSSQNQHNYTNASRHQTYGTDAWKAPNAQNASYDDRRQTDGYAKGGATGGSGQEYYNSTSSTSAEQDAQGLNNLVYASGVEGSAVQRHTHRVHPTSVSSATRYPPTSGPSAPNQVRSPVTQSASHYNENQSIHYPYQTEPSSITSQQPAMSSATARVGVVNHRFPHSSVSPVMDGLNATQAAPTQRTASPYPRPQLTQNQGQLGAFSGTTQASYGTTNNSSGTMGQQWSQSGNTGQHIRTSSQNVQTRTSEVQNKTPAPVNSISNLVSNTMEEASQAVYSPTVESQNTVLDYIDPSKVFNPCHLEHERRRREAEALAKKKAEEEAAAAPAAAKSREEEAARKKREDEEAARKKREDEEAARKKRKYEETAGKKIQEAAKALTKRQGAKPTIATNPRTSDQASRKVSPTTTKEAHRPFQQTEQPSQDGATSEASMAAELKALMDKMKEFRSKDPMLFQKLWEDMRKPGQSSTVPANAAHSPSPQISQQSIPAPQHQVVADPRPRHIPTAVQTSSPSPQVAHAQAVPHTQLRPGIVEPPRSRTVRGGTPDGSAAKRNGYRVVVEDNPEGLPDLGRFPAERRVRTTYNKKSTATKKSLPDAAASLSASTKSNTEVPPPTPTLPQIAAPPASVALKFSNITSPPLSQGLPPKVLSGGTIWPEEKRNALAEAAVKSLTSLPENSEIEIGPADIHSMLDKNPSYIDLCEMLEGKGLKFHRGHFARQLLSNVPYLNSPQTRAKEAIQPQPQPETQLPSQIPSGPPHIPMAHSPIPPPPFINGQQFIPGQPHIPAQNTSEASLPTSTLPQQRQQTIKTENITSTSQNRRTGKTNPVGPSRVEPPPGSKEAMARKRDFSELVDLTALSDNENYVMSRKQARVESPPERDPFEQYQAQMISAAQSLSPGQEARAPRYPPFQSGIPLKFNPTQTSIPPGPQPLSKPSLSTPVPEHPVSTRILAKPINKSEALRKTYYNPKTVARDILVSAGRHPFERPLNAHLAGLLGKHIDLYCDLSTFDWDAVDPGGPRPPQVALVDVPTEPPRYKFGEQAKRRIRPDKDKDSPLPDSEKRSLPAPVPDVSEQREKKAKPLQASTGPSNNLRTSDDGGENAKAIVPTPRARSTRSSSTPLNPRAEPRKMSSGSNFPSGKRRGRPPGARNLHHRESVGAIKPGSIREISVTIPSPASPSLPVFKCHWKGCKAHLHNLETLRQHISKVHCPTADEVKEADYICWWRNCRHLVKENGLVNPQISFPTFKEWLDHIDEDHLHAVALKYGDGPSTKHIGKQESTSFDVSRFLYNPQSRQATRTVSYTDPQTILLDRTRYLSDEYGRTTTPAVSEKSQKDLEPDTMALLKAEHDDAERTAQRSFMRTHRPEKSSSKAVAEETLRAMEARKAALGPGIDKGGCVLVNEARRSTLIQNQGIRRVVDADY